MTIREFFASGQKGDFAMQLLRTYDDPCAGNFRLLRAVADGRNGRLVDKVTEDGDTQNGALAHALYRVAFRAWFPMLQELDRELNPSDYARLPRESAKGGSDDADNSREN